MKLATRYLGLDLPHPFMPGASPLADSIDAVLRLEDAGAAALVLNSLFEEDIVRHGVVPERYLEHLLRIKQRTNLPVIASLNGITAEGWLQYARLLERAGAARVDPRRIHPVGTGSPIRVDRGHAGARQSRARNGPCRVRAGQLHAHASGVAWR